MSTASIEDAQRLLGQPLYCVDCGGWTPVPGRSRTLVISNGVTDEHGHGTRLSVDLMVRTGRAGPVTYVFSVLNSLGYDVERVYQLEVNCSVSLSEHRRSHEHFGDARIIGTDKWSLWSCDELLQYFSGRTNIRFIPPPPDPGLPRRRKR